MEELGREIMHGESSNNERPKWNVESSGENVVISFNESRDEVWKVGKAEIEAYRDQICTLTKQNFEDIDPINDIFELFMGKSKPRMQLMNVIQTGFSLSWYFMYSESIPFVC
jgi:hypothetical protein